MALTTIKTNGLADNSVTDAKVANAITVTGAQTGITQVGTLTAGTWNGTAIASAYLDADTAHLTTTQTFSGAKTFSALLEIKGADVVTSGSQGAQLYIQDTAAYNAAQVSGLQFRQIWHSDGSLTSTSGIYGSRESTTSGQYGGALHFQTRVHGGNLADKMVIDSSGNVGIGGVPDSCLLHVHSASAGSVSPNAAADELVLENSGAVGMTMFGGSGSTCTIAMGDSESNYQGVIIYDNNNSNMTFKTANAEAIRIDANQRVGIGSQGSTLIGYADAAANNLVVGSSTGDEGITIISGASAGDYGALYFGDANRGTNGRIMYEQNNEIMSFYTNNTEKMRILLDGSVVINNAGSDGQLYFGGTSGTSRMYVSRSGADSLLWNVDAGNLKLGTNNAERIRILSDGDVLIGSAGGNENSIGHASYNNPSQRVEINGTWGSPRHGDGSNAGNTGAIFRLAGGGHSNALDMGVEDASPYSAWIQGTDRGSSNGHANVYALALNPQGGNVGVGILAPSANLHLHEASGTSYQYITSGDNQCVIHMGAKYGQAGVKWGTIALDNNGNLKLLSGGSLSSPGLVIDTSGNATIAGSLSKGSGSFKIDHPLPSKKDTHYLVHSFTESPRADLIYRDKVTLVDGSATVNIDTVAGMTEGTFVLLCDNVQCFTSNESDWKAVKGSVSGNILTIECEDSSSTADVSWMVVGDRKDKHIMDTDWTDENGKPIVEPEKENA